jgi:phospholipid/cholesterol/gamma-HCH transport system substrate-binding protein
MLQTVADVQAMVHNVRRGEGTLGGFVNDAQIYDDVKELMRDLRRNPWKFFWRD